MIGQITEYPAAERPHQETRREKKRRIKLLHHGIGRWEEGAGEIKRESRVGVEIIPFNEIADRTDKDRLDAPPHVGKVEMVGRGRCRSGGRHRDNPRKWPPR